MNFLINKWSSSWFNKIIILIVSFVISFVVFFVFYNFIYAKDSIQHKSAPVASKQEPIIIEDFNVLLAGIDEREGDKGRTDTLILLQASFESKKISLISIPRDSYVEFEKHKDKINHIYAYSNIEETKKAVENLTGITINYHVLLKVNNVKEIIDDLGGISINIEKDMKYSDPYDDDGGLYIDLKAGEQKLDGEHSLHFLRYRDEEGDIGRTKRQQQFLKSVFDQLKNFEVSIKLHSIISKLYYSIETDIPITKMILFTNFFNLDKVDIKANTLPGFPEYINDISYWIVDKEKTVQLVKENYAFLSADKKNIDENNVAKNNDENNIDVVSLENAKKAENSLNGVPLEFLNREIPEKNKKEIQNKNEQRESKKNAWNNIERKNNNGNGEKEVIGNNLKIIITNTSNNFNNSEKMKRELVSKFPDAHIINIEQPSVNMSENTKIIVDTTNSDVLKKVNSFNFPYDLSIKNLNKSNEVITVVIGKSYIKEDNQKIK